MPAGPAAVWCPIQTNWLKFENLNVNFAEHSASLHCFQHLFLRWNPGGERDRPWGEQDLGIFLSSCKYYFFVIRNRLIPVKYFAAAMIIDCWVLNMLSYPNYTVKKIRRSCPQPAEDGKTANLFLQCTRIFLGSYRRSACNVFPSLCYRISSQKYTPSSFKTPSFLLSLQLWTRSTRIAWR